MAHLERLTIDGYYLHTEEPGDAAGSLLHRCAHGDTLIDGYPGAYVVLEEITGGAAAAEAAAAQWSSQS